MVRAHDLYYTYMTAPTQFISRIISNDRIGDGFYELSLSWDSRAGVPAPGQFLTVRVGGGSVPLLRRPFAFAGFDADSSVAAVIYQKRGPGTELLAAARSGEGLDVIGPLGRPFFVDDKDMGINTGIDTGIDTAKHIIAAGGIGLGPMLFLAASLKSRNIPTIFVFGCRNKSFIPSIKKFTDIDPRICTDDGSAGFRGTVADYIGANIILDINNDVHADTNINTNINTNTDTDVNTNTTIYACGPLPMLKSINTIAKKSGVRCLVSLEAVMACGVGACMGCVAPTENGYRRVCKEGPVFDSKDILWEKM
ncbi:dihydroorotate dehydrogenase [Fibrobacteres bacterium R8-0-B4]